jgi:hypothetical protein
LATLKRSDSWSKSTQAIRIATIVRFPNLPRISLSPPCYRQCQLLPCEAWSGSFPTPTSYQLVHGILKQYFKEIAENVIKVEDIINVIDNRRKLHKVTKSKSVFPTDDSLLKMLYLAMVDITRKWTGLGASSTHKCRFFAERMPG